MTVYLGDLTTEVLQRLGDSAGAIWTETEIEDYIKEGYNDLTIRTGCLWGVACLPDYAFAFNYTWDGELIYVETVGGWYADGPAGFTGPDDRDFANNALGPANHTEHWEFNDSYQTITEVSPVVELPTEVYELERAVWNTKRIETMRSSSIEPRESRYELAKGVVEAYIQDKDGLRKLRKWRVPSTAYTPFDFDDGSDLTLFTYNQSWESTYIPTGGQSAGPLDFTSAADYPFTAATDYGVGTHNQPFELIYSGETASNDDGFGIIRYVGDIATSLAVDGDWGDLVHIDAVNVFEDYGILGPVYKEPLDVRIEYRRRGDVTCERPFEVADRCTVYIRHYAMSMALDRDGHGYEPELAKHYFSRYLDGINRMMARRAALQYQKTTVMGGASSNVMGGPKLARLPWQYGRRVR